jgi:hypothetical protein
LLGSREIIYSEISCFKRGIFKEHIYQSFCYELERKLMFSPQETKALGDITIEIKVLCHIPSGKYVLFSLYLFQSQE